MKTIFNWLKGLYLKLTGKTVQAQTAAEPVDDGGGPKEPPVGP